MNHSSVIGMYVRLVAFVGTIIIVLLATEDIHTLAQSQASKFASPTCTSTRLSTNDNFTIPSRVSSADWDSERIDVAGAIEADALIRAAGQRAGVPIGNAPYYDYGDLPW